MNLKKKIVEATFLSALGVAMYGLGGGVADASPMSPIRLRRRGRKTDMAGGTGDLRPSHPGVGLPGYYGGGWGQGWGC